MSIETINIASTYTGTTMGMPMAVIDTVWEPHTYPTSYLKPFTIAAKPLHMLHPDTHPPNLVHSVHTHLPWHQHSHGTQPEVCPETDIRETAQAYHIEMALAGVSDKDRVLIKLLAQTNKIFKGGLTKPEAQVDREAAGFVCPPVEEKFGGTLKKVSASGNLSQKDRSELEKIQTGVIANGNNGKIIVDGPDHCGRPFVLKERTLGLFQRTFTLPIDADVEGYKVRLEHGLLRIDIPKKEPQEKQEDKVILDDDMAMIGIPKKHEGRLKLEDG